MKYSVEYAKLSELKNGRESYRAFLHEQYQQRIEIQRFHRLLLNDELIYIAVHVHPDTFHIEVSWPCWAKYYF